MLKESVYYYYLPDIVSIYKFTSKVQESINP